MAESKKNVKNENEKKKKSTVSKSETTNSKKSTSTKTNTNKTKNTVNKSKTTNNTSATKKNNTKKNNSTKTTNKKTNSKNNTNSKKVVDNNKKKLEVKEKFKEEKIDTKTDSKDTKKAKKIEKTVKNKKSFSIKNIFKKKEKNLNDSTSDKKKSFNIKNVFKKKNKDVVVKGKAVKKSDDKVNNKKPLFSSKKTKIAFIVVAIICGLIIIAESIMLVLHFMDVEKNTTYYDMYNSVTLDDTDILAVGQSDFRYSDDYSYTKDYVKAKLIKYDKNGKILFEKMYEKGITTTFNSVITVDDGYIVVGSGIFSDKEMEAEGREAFIVKYDKDGNIVWENFYSVLTNTAFNKVILVDDGYIAIGQSIYANFEMGNHTTGGGIIVKYGFDGKEKWHNNHGGTKSGSFNDIVKVGSDFYVVGKDGVDSANIVKYDKTGKYLWHKNYRYTDALGFTGITYVDNSLYVVGSKKILPEGTTDEDDRTTDNTDCLLVKYDLEGTIVFEKAFGGSSNERYNSIVSYHNNLYVVGHTTSKDAGLIIDTDGELLTGIAVRYDIDGNILKKVVYGGSNNETLTDIVTDGVSLFVSGYSNSKDSTVGTSKDNGKDYFGRIVKSDLKFRKLMVK